jgi:hypothetical protein
MNIIDGVAEMARLAASGFADSTTAESRLSICNDCPEFLPQYIGGEFNPQTGGYGVWTEKKLCKLCGCSMPWKVKFNGADCPLEKW